VLGRNFSQVRGGLGAVGPTFARVAARRRAIDAIMPVAVEGSDVLTQGKGGCHA